MSHEDAKRRDARSVLSRGETYRVVITEPGVDSDGKGMGKIERIRIFVHPKGEPLEYADTVKVKIADVGDSHAEALVVEKLD